MDCSMLGVTRKINGGLLKQKGDYENSQKSEKQSS